MVWQLVGVGTFSHTNPAIHLFSEMFHVAACTCGFWGFRSSGAKDSVRLLYETM